MTQEDLDALFDERRQINDRVVLKLEDGTILAEGFRPLTLYEEHDRGYRRFIAGGYTIDAAIRFFGFSRAALERKIRERLDAREPGREPVRVVVL